MYSWQGHLDSSLELQFWFPKLWNWNIWFGFPKVRNLFDWFPVRFSILGVSTWKRLPQSVISPIMWYVGLLFISISTYNCMGVLYICFVFLVFCVFSIAYGMDSTKIDTNFDLQSFEICHYDLRHNAFWGRVLHICKSFPHAIMTKYNVLYTTRDELSVCSEFQVRSFGA